MMDSTEFESEESISKTKTKKLMLDLQQLGQRLTTLSKSEREKLDISTELEESINNYLKIKSHGAKRRQLQYIGRLMRELDNNKVNTISAYFMTLDGDSEIYQAYIKRLEQYRLLLLDDEQYLTDFMRQFPQVDAGFLRTLIRNHKKELNQQKPLKSFREIFQYLKQIDPFVY